MSEPESLLVTRPMTDAERAVVALSTLPPALTWGASGTAVGGVIAEGARHLGCGAGESRRRALRGAPACRFCTDVPH